MKGHDLARKLLALEDKEVMAVKALEKGYTKDFDLSDPWADPFGNIRIQLSENENETKAGDQK